MSGKKTWLQDLPFMQSCPCCPGRMLREAGSPDTYQCVDCGVRVWADPIGCGLVRYNILPAERPEPPQERREGN